MPDDNSLRRLWPIAACLFAAAALRFALFHPLASNELDTLLTAKRFADPEFLTGDWFLGLPQGPRRPFQIALWPLAAWLPLPALSVVGRLLGYAALSVSLARMAVLLRVGAPMALAAGTLFVWLGQSLAGGEWLFGTVESKVAAYALVLWAVGDCSEGRLRRAFALAGLATTLHVLVGAQASLGLAVAAWPELRRGDGFVRRLAGIAAAWLLCALPALAILATAAGDQPPAGVDIAWIYVVFRTPHHSDPRTWQVTWRLLAEAGWQLAALIWLPRALPALPAAATAARFAWGCLLPFALGLAAAQFDGGIRLLQLLPFRVGGAMVVLVPSMLVAAWLQAKIVAARWCRMAWGVAGACGIASAAPVAGYLDDWQKFPIGGQPQLPAEQATSLARACAWIRTNTQPAELLLASPALESAGYLANRPVVATYTQVPPSRSHLAQWFARIVALNGGKVPARHGSAMLDELDAGFESLTPPQVQQLAQIYGASTLLIRRAGLPFALLRSDGPWHVYRIVQ